MKYYTYFIILLGTVLFPFIYSFESKRIAFYTKWKLLFPSLIITAALFVVWDYYFTKWGVWGFNPEYVTGIYILNLPVEEVLFFVAIPFSCLFIYEAVGYYFPNDLMRNYSVKIALILACLFAVVAVFNPYKLYTTAAFSIAALVLLVHALVYNNKFLGKFFLMYLIHLVPFFIVNGFLTYLPVVLYNDSENMGIRIGSIPLEDTVYSMSLLLINVTLYEALKTNYNYKINYNA